MAAGDVLLFSRKVNATNFRADPFGTLMCALIHLTTRSRFNHVSLDIGEGLMVEATSKGVAVNPIRSTDEITVIPVARQYKDFRISRFAAMCVEHKAGYSGNDLEETLAWATGRVGWKYGTLNAFWCGLRNVFPGAAHIKHGKTIICSELVSEALARAGHDWKTDYALVSPGDVAEHFGVKR
jgi:uncharacterized protein YycO